MKVLKYFVVTLCLLPFGNSAFATPISVNDLYVSSAHAVVDMSPNGRYLIDYGRREAERGFAIIDLDTMEVLAQLPVDSNVRVNEIAWLSNEYIYLNFTVNGKKFTKIGLFDSGKLSFSAMNKAIDIVGVVDEMVGRLVVTLLRADGRVSEIAELSAKDIYENKLENARVIKTKAGGYDYYFYDRFTQKILARDLNKEKKRLSVVSMPLSGGSWQSVGAVDLDESRFYYVGFLTDSLLAVLTDEGAPRVVLRTYDLKTQKFGDILYQHPHFDLTDASINALGDVEYVQYEQRGLKVRDYLHSDSAVLASRFQKTFKNQEVFIADRSVHDDRVLLYVRGSMNPGEFYMYRRDKDLIEGLFKSYPQLEDTRFAPTQHVVARAEDGTEIEGYLVTPAAGAIDHKVLLVIPHGGPIGIKDSADFNVESQYFASRGFSVLRVNFRGSFGYGKEFQEQGVGEFGRLIESDISAVVEQVRGQHHFQNMCALGGSYGGYSSVMLAIKNPELYRCVVGSFGVYDLPLLFNHSNHRVFNTKEIERIVGPYREELRAVSPTHLISELKAPILLIAGYDDKIARFEHSNRFKYLLEKADHPVETLFYKNTGHGHQSFIGDRLDAATSYLFVMKSLGIDIPLPSELDTAGRKALAEDYIVVADSFNFNKNTPNDSDKAYAHYLLAAEYGQSRAQHNIAAYLRTGVTGKKDFEAALKWYEKASDNGYANASYALADYHARGTFEGVNKSLVLPYYRKAKDQGHDYASLMIAKSECLALEAGAPAESCIAALSAAKAHPVKSADAEDYDRAVRDAISAVFELGNFSGVEREKLIRFAVEQYAAARREFSCLVTRKGYRGRTLVEGGKTIDMATYIEFEPQTEAIPADKNHKLTLEYVCNSAGDNHHEKAILLARWITPDIFDSDGMQIKSQTHLLIPSMGTKYEINYKLEYPSEIVTSDWALELETLDGQLIYRQGFSTLLPEPDDVVMH